MLPGGGAHTELHGDRLLGVVELPGHPLAPGTNGRGVMGGTESGGGPDMLGADTWRWVRGGGRRGGEGSGPYRRGADGFLMSLHVHELLRWVPGGGARQPKAPRAPSCSLPVCRRKGGGPEGGRGVEHEGGRDLHEDAGVEEVAVVLEGQHVPHHHVVLRGAAGGTTDRDSETRARHTNITGKAKRG